MFVMFVVIVIVMLQVTEFCTFGSLYEFLHSFDDAQAQAQARPHLHSAASSSGRPASKRISSPKVNGRKSLAAAAAAMTTSNDSDSPSITMVNPIQHSDSYSGRGDADEVARAATLSGMERGDRRIAIQQALAGDRSSMSGGGVDGMQSSSWRSSIFARSSVASAVSNDVILHLSATSSKK